MGHTSHLVSNVNVSYYFVVVVTMPDFTGEEIDTFSNLPKVTQL